MIPARTSTGRKLHLSAGDGRTLCGHKALPAADAVDCESCLWVNDGWAPPEPEHPMRKVWDACRRLDAAYEAML